MADRFNGPNHVEAGVGVARGDEIAPLKHHLVADVVAFRVLVGGIDLMRRDGYARDPRPFLTRQPDGAAAHAAAGVEHGVLVGDTGPFGENLVFAQQRVGNTFGGFIPVTEV